MKNIPNRIFLQLGVEEGTIVDFDSLPTNCISWCSNKIYSDDLTFISVDFILAEIDKLKDYANSSDDYEKAEFTINVLKNLIK